MKKRPLKETVLLNFGNGGIEGVERGTFVNIAEMVSGSVFDLQS